MKVRREQKIARIKKQKGKKGTPVEAMPNPELGHKLIPKLRYTDTGFAQEEWDKMWKKVWLLGCREDDIPNPGDHYVTEIGNESILDYTG